MNSNVLGVRVLRLEAAAILALLISIYMQREGSWILFGLLILAPDLSALGYFAGSKQGAITYNVGHTAIWPAVLGVFALVADSPLACSIAIIWGAHIAFDRAIGYGFKDADNPLPGRRRRVQSPPAKE